MGFSSTLRGPRGPAGPAGPQGPAGSGGSGGSGELTVAASAYSTQSAPIDPTGVVDSRAGLQAAFAAANAAKKGLEIADGTYLLSKNPAGAYSLDVPGHNFVVRGNRGRVIFKHMAGMSASVAILRVDNKNNTRIEGIFFHGNWGNYLTRIADGSHGATLPQATIYVENTAEFNASGTFYYVDDAGGPHLITYTGKTATTFTGCTGGTATLKVGVRVGVEIDKAGLNLIAQVDPKSHGIMVRGATNTHIEACDFYQIYGDAIWLGSSSTDFKNGANRVQVYNCSADVCARSGIAIGQKSEELHVFRSSFTNICAGAFDTEAQGGLRAQWIRDVVAESSRFGTWWCPHLTGRSGNVSMSIVGCAAWPNANNDARKYRVHDCDVEGSCTIQSGRDVAVTENRFEINHGGVGYAPILVRMCSDDILVRGNWIFDRGIDTGAAPHEACIDVQVYSGGTGNYTPGNVMVSQNTVYARNGRIGVQVKGVGGGAYSSGAADQNGDTGTATMINTEYPHNAQGDAGEIFVCTNGGGTATTVTAQNATWAVDARVGWIVRSMAGAQMGRVTSNTANTLTFTSGWRDDDNNAAVTPNFAQTAGVNPSFSTYPVLEDTTKAWTPNMWATRRVTRGGLTAGIIGNWQTILILDRTGGWHDHLEGIPRPTPALGAYLILPAAGVVTVDRNMIDCGADQNTAGGVGIKVFSSKAGGRVKLDRNIIKNAMTDAIVVECSGTPRLLESLEITNNDYIDVQATRTMTNGIKFVGALDAKRFTMRGNSVDDPALMTSMTGLTAGVWLEEDGVKQRWAGFAVTPEALISARPGSEYANLNGGLSTTRFVKESGTGNTGWVALGGSAGAALPVWASQLGLLGGAFDPSALGSVSVTLTAGTMFMFKVRAYSTSISKVVFHGTVAIVGGTNFYVGLYRADGTQSASMATATVDAFASVGTTGIKTITLTNAVTVGVGDDIYVALLVTGAPTTALQIRSNVGNVAINGNLTAAQGFRSGAAAGAGLTLQPASVTLTTMAASSAMGWVGIQ